MGKNNNFVKEITPMEENFAQWYTDVIRKTDLIDYSSVKGFYVVKPYGYALWENIQKYLDMRFKETGHQNLYFPLLISESLLNKEKDHVEGFAPEVAWVTMGGQNELPERLCIRPTSETIICSMYSKWLKSYRELPYLYNQWSNVLRWEKETRPFLRHREFLWQEGHTLHETEKEAVEETLLMLRIYKDLAEDMLALGVIDGRKSDKEKFAGAVSTYTIEAMMRDGKALQAGTSHYLGQHFANAFDITFLDREGKLQRPHSTSWGVSTRLIGALIMAHGDNRGLVIPPNIAPTQVVIVPIRQKDEGVLDKASEIQEELKSLGVSVKLDDNDNVSPGWKFNQYEMLGIPVRIEVGPRDIKSGIAQVFRRDTLEKVEVKLEDLASYVKELLVTIQSDMLKNSQKMLEERTYSPENLDDLYKSINEKPGFYKIDWCGCVECEEKLKEEESITVRCIDSENTESKCIVCGKDSKFTVVTGKAY